MEPAATNGTVDVVLALLILGGVVGAPNRRADGYRGGASGEVVTGVMVPSQNELYSLGQQLPPVSIRNMLPECEGALISPVLNLPL